MPTQIDAKAIAYLPWARQGLGGRAAELGAVADQGRLKFTLNPQLQREGDTPGVSPVGMPVLRLQGPPDVAGLDDMQVIRTDPPHLATAFEPNYFALVEFDQPDLPWLFAPTVPQGQGADSRCQPWLTLVVVPAGAAEYTPPTSDAPGRLVCATSELPPLQDAWAWAHVQIVAGDTATTVAGLLADAPRSLSRLICARRLDPLVAYVACVVPTYELGRLAGLGPPPSAAQLAALHLQPAWNSGNPAAPVTLPVFHGWTFTTAAGGDFEARARRLSPRALAPGAGTQEIDVSAPGWGIRTDTGGTLPQHGALRLPQLAAGAAWIQNDQLTRELLAVLSAPAQVADGLVGPPLYGQAYVRLNALGVDLQAAPSWLGELNLSIEHRIAAGMGVQVVRIEQEALMAAAWDQLAEVERHNRSVRRQQLADAVGGSRAALAGTSPAVAPPTPLRAGLAARSSLRAAFPTTAAGRRPILALPAVARLTRPEARATTRAAPSAQPEETTLSPSFVTPAAELLKDFFPTFLFPGLDRLPAESVTVLEPNPPFIEAFLVGLNHELGREMLWRGFPADTTGTPFQRFWPGLPDANRLSAPQRRVARAAAALERAANVLPEALRAEDSRATPSPAQRSAMRKLARSRATLAQAVADLAQAGDPGADIAPVATWDAAAALGAHPPVGATAVSRIVVALKGELLQRYPRAAIYAQQAVWNGSAHALGTSVKTPLFQMDRAPDVTLLAFDLSAQALCGAPAPGDAGWFIVLQELPGEPRFGLDAVPEDVAAWGGLPAAWSDLGWSNVAAGAQALAQLRYVPLQALPSQALPLVAGQPIRATWGRSSADQAAVTRQRPFRLAIHGSQWFSAEGPT
jgi:hypothetical protein